MTKEVNYTPELFEQIKTRYLANPTREEIDAMAVEYDRTVRSIVGKLSKEGLYKRPEYRTKRGEVPKTKEQIVAMIAEEFDEPEINFDGLEKAPKTVLRKILVRINPEREAEFK